MKKPTTIAVKLGVKPEYVAAGFLRYHRLDLNMTILSL